MYCGLDGAGCYGKFRQLTTDHVIPTAHVSWRPGQDRDAENTVVACHRCNTLKRDNFPREVNVARLHELKAEDRVRVLKENLPDFSARDKADWEHFKQGLVEERQR